MKVYIGSRQINDESYKVLTEPQMLNYIAHDAECTAIVLDGILRKKSLANVAEVLQLCRKKLRIGGVIKIIDVDFDLLLYTHRKIGNIVELNNAFFMNTEVRSFLNLEIINQIVGGLGEMILTKSNINNIEFDLEFTRV